MTWIPGALLLMFTTVGVASIRHAIERGDLDEAARQGVLAGPAVVERALGAVDRSAQLGGIVAAPAVDVPAQLLPALAALAAGSDRRVAIPAARAAWRIAAAMASPRGPGDATRGGPDDDISDDELAEDRAQWLALARRADRWIEVRVTALAVAAALDPDAISGDLPAILGDPDPAVRRAVLALIPQPTPPAARATLVDRIEADDVPAVALAAAQALCADLITDDPAPVLDALGDHGLVALRARLAGGPPPGDPGAVRDAARCLAADGSPASLAALRALAGRVDPALRQALAPLLSPRR